MSNQKFQNLDQFMLLVRFYLKSGTRLIDLLSQLKSDALIFNISFHTQFCTSYIHTFSCGILIELPDGRIIPTPRLKFVVDRECNVTCVEINQSEEYNG